MNGKWYCHGDNDPSPTCYERRSALLSLTLMAEESPDGYR